MIRCSLPYFLFLSHSYSHPHPDPLPLQGFWPRIWSLENESKNNNSNGREMGFLCVALKDRTRSHSTLQWNSRATNCFLLCRFLNRRFPGSGGWLKSNGDSYYLCFPSNKGKERREKKSGAINILRVSVLIKRVVGNGIPGSQLETHTHEITFQYQIRGREARPDSTSPMRLSYSY